MIHKDSKLHEAVFPSVEQLDTVTVWVCGEGCVRWWGCVRADCRRRCDPAGAAGRSSGASAQPRARPWSSHRPCWDLDREHNLSSEPPHYTHRCPEELLCVFGETGSHSPFSRAEDQSCTDMSGILLANCIAGTTMLLLSWTQTHMSSSSGGMADG